LNQLQLDLFGETPAPDLFSANVAVPVVVLPAPEPQTEASAPTVAKSVLPGVVLPGVVDPERAARIEGVGELRIRWHRAYCESVKAGAPDMDALHQLGIYERTYFELTKGLRDFGDGHTWDVIV
jgi:hypothetical protein